VHFLRAECRRRRNARLSAANAKPLISSSLAESVILASARFFAPRQLHSQSTTSKIGLDFFSFLRRLPVLEVDPWHMVTIEIDPLAPIEKRRHVVPHDKKVSGR